MDSAALLEGLNEAQRQAVTSEAAPLVILAGAGSGKTRVLTRRIAYRCVTEAADPRHVVALTFTRKAAGELSNRLRALGIRDHIAAGTFHAVAYAQLRRSWADRRVQAPELLERKGQLLGRLLGRGSGVKAVDVAGEIEWAKARMIAPADYPREAAAARRRPPMAAEALAELYDRYEQEKRNRRLVDFDDLLRLCAHGIETDAEFAAAQRWQFRHLFVDEFQDVNPLQFRLLEAWRGDRLDLCVVGDPNQAIYAWNGADPTLINKLADRIPGTETVTLETTTARRRRSSPRPTACSSAARYRSCACEPRAPKASCPRCAPTPATRKRRKRLPRRSPAATAATRRGRTTPCSPARTRRPCCWPSRSGPSAHPSAFAARRRSSNCRRFVRRSARCVARERGSATRSSSSRCACRSTSTSTTSATTRTTSTSTTPSSSSRPPRNCPTRRSLASATSKSLLRLANEYLAEDGTPTSAGFETWLRAVVGTDDGGGGGDAVDIATFHAAKGLEWPIVHLAGLE